jgi:hypothetical protein
MKRNEDGTFPKGVSGNPTGRPKRTEHAERLYSILQTELTAERWRDIVLKAVDQAKKGDKAARKWLSDYGIGTPEQRMALYAGESTELTIRYVDDWRVNE